jgi:hypothetical protein
MEDQMYARSDGAGEAPGEHDQVHPVALDAARYVCRQLPGVAKTTFVKLLYLTDREYASRYGHGLLGTRWWREDQGPLSSGVTKMIGGPEFRQEETKTSSGNPRVGHIEAEAALLSRLGSAELTVLDTVIAEFGRLGQVELLARVHDLPEVRDAQLKHEIKLPTTVPAHGTAEYLNALTAEIERERDAAIYNSAFHEDDNERKERQDEARGGVRAIV